MRTTYRHNRSMPIKVELKEPYSKMLIDEYKVLLDSDVEKSKILTQLINELGATEELRNAHEQLNNILRTNKEVINSLKPVESRHAARPNTDKEDISQILDLFHEYLNGKDSSFENLVDQIMDVFEHQNLRQADYSMAGVSDMMNTALQSSQLEDLEYSNFSQEELLENYLKMLENNLQFCKSFQHLISYFSKRNGFVPCSSSRHSDTEQHMFLRDRINILKALLTSAIIAVRQTLKNRGRIATERNEMFPGVDSYENEVNEQTQGFEQYPHEWYDYRPPQPVKKHVTFNSDNSDMECAILSNAMPQYIPQPTYSGYKSQNAQQNYVMNNRDQRPAAVERFDVETPTYPATIPTQYVDSRENCYNQHPARNYMPQPLRTNAPRRVVRSAGGTSSRQRINDAPVPAPQRRRDQPSTSQRQPRSTTQPEQADARATETAAGQPPAEHRDGADENVQSLPPDKESENLKLQVKADEAQESANNACTAANCAQDAACFEQKQANVQQQENMKRELADTSKAQNYANETRIVAKQSRAIADEARFLAATFVKKALKHNSVFEEEMKAIEFALNHEETANQSLNKERENLELAMHAQNSAFLAITKAIQAQNAADTTQKRAIKLQQEANIAHKRAVKSQETANEEQNLVTPTEKTVEKIRENKKWAVENKKLAQRREEYAAKNDNDASINKKLAIEYQELKNIQDENHADLMQHANASNEQFNLNKIETLGNLDTLIFLIEKRWKYLMEHDEATMDKKKTLDDLKDRALALVSSS